MPIWINAANRIDLGFTEFEPMLSYPDDLTVRLLNELSGVLDKTQNEILEDLGTYLVSHPNVEALRRLMRFGGVNFTEFIHSLDDLPARVRIAVPDLSLPSLEVHSHAPNVFCLTIQTRTWERLRYGRVFLGLLRALADDYGALVVLDYTGTNPDQEVVEISLLEPEFAQGRNFDLALRAG